MEFQIVNPDNKRMEKREARIRKTLNKMPRSILKGELQKRERLALENLEGMQDEDRPGVPGIMISALLWDAYIENILIVRKMQKEIA